ncbi:lipid kinase, YegS/Rv2252/BmrU family [Hathewaya proteolytica DSM 3090]|uniref:Lipid kinase, YegS/Rv2252/BmrU family n=1 Tax=Hathewaya proteolytica DSM 3090 TaxID=1121331 RepID=A0A1M6NAH5_9CLOT|nr:YegS/Rv2252/BmrU family lipid kinase [Hathewaya proteolytica]SHJ92657.1 lipid kinase, YegS/Rv2252/BmrU family [Hathewaya proteolytica DSM 3090]
MNKVKLIYNPYAGENQILSKLDTVIKVHQENGYSIIPYRITRESSMEEAFQDLDEDYSYILVAGGDGTVDCAVNIMKNKNIDKPMGILPVGTANDFARFIGMTGDVLKDCEKIIHSKPKAVDLGKMNEKYFINVGSTGLFTDISQKTDVNLKNTIGKLAYYIKGVEQIHTLRRLKAKITSEEYNFHGDMYLVLVFNGRTAGGFNLAYNSVEDDGLLDVIIIEGVKIHNIINIFIKILKGEYLEGTPGVIYFKTKELVIDTEEDIVTDIDGERGPNFPVRISCVKGGINILGCDNNSDGEKALE